MSVVGRTFEIVGTIFTLYGLVYAWRRSTNRIRDAVDWRAVQSELGDDIS
jgi:hypothetical protein